MRLNSNTQAAAIGITQNFRKPKLTSVMIERDGNFTFHGGNFTCHGGNFTFHGGNFFLRGLE